MYNFPVNRQNRIARVEFRFIRIVGKYAARRLCPVCFKQPNADQLLRSIPLQTDPFIQHFNNIFYSNPPYRTFAECEEAIDRLTGFLQLPYLGKIEFVEFVSGEQPRFKKINFPGVKALKYDILAMFYKKITNNELPEG